MFVGTLRKYFSGNRSRCSDGAVDLDLTYITPRIIAMSFPASGIEKAFRNDINEVAQFLTMRHGENFRVYNLSERFYDSTKFRGKVVDCGWPDHCAPRLQLLWQICVDVHSWLGEASSNVAVIHCLAGKGRTGVLVSSYLLLGGYFGNIASLANEESATAAALDAMDHFFGNRGEGIENPSQVRYVKYIAQILHSDKSATINWVPSCFTPRPRHLKQISVSPVPNLETANGCGFTPVFVVAAAGDTKNVLYNSAWGGFTTYQASQTSLISIPVDVTLHGDIVISGYHIGPVSLFQSQPQVSLRLTVNIELSFPPERCHASYGKEELDFAVKDVRFHDNFQIELFFDNALMPTGFSEPVINKHREETCGWLWKLGGVVKSWKMRWFVLNAGRLVYFDSPASVLPLGSIDLKNRHIESMMRTDVQKPKSTVSTFGLVPEEPGGRIYTLGAISEKDYSLWLNAIAKELAIATYGMQG